MDRDDAGKTRPDWVDASLNMVISCEQTFAQGMNLKEHIMRLEMRLGDALDNVPGENVAQVRRDSYNEALEDIATRIDADADAMARAARWVGGFEKYKEMMDHGHQLKERASEIRAMRKVAP